jgi:hypothetical protein
MRLERLVGLGLALLLGAPAGLPSVAAQALPSWVVAGEAKSGLSELWAESIAARRERVACLGGTIARDTVWIERVRLLKGEYADSLTAAGQGSIAQCAPPEWMGTVHTHVRSTDDPSPAPRFSPGDRTVMSLWAQQWARRGAFCVLYSRRDAHCETYPPGDPPRPLPDGEARSPGP